MDRYLRKNELIFSLLVIVSIKQHELIFVVNSLFPDTSIAELIKEVTDSDEFMDNLRTQQEFINGIDTDKAHPYLEDCIARQESIVKAGPLCCIWLYMGM